MLPLLIRIKVIIPIVQRAVDRISFYLSLPEVAHKVEIPNLLHGKKFLLQYQDKRIDHA